MKANTLKISKARLKQIILEEIEKFESEISQREEEELEGEEEELEEDIDPLTGTHISKKQAKQNKTPQKRKDRLGVAPEPLTQLANGVLEEKQVIYNRDQLVQKCRALGLQSFADILKSMDAMKRAADGKLTEKK